MESEYKKTALLAADESHCFRECAFFKSEDGFVHPNRVLDFDVLIYVVSGSVQVVEDDQEYCILPGELLFLKHGLSSLWNEEKSTYDKLVLFSLLSSGNYGTDKI